MEKALSYPVDSASFRNIRENGMVYVDKTSYIDSLVRNNGKYYFLARPRRFGKSLFLDSLAEYFKGNKSLFHGLAIEKLQPGEWEEFPVIRFNLTGQAYLDKDALPESLAATIRREAEVNGLVTTDSNSTIYDYFLNLLNALYNKTGKKVVILIDEYDAPLTSSIDKPELQEVYRDQLHGFYSVLKKAEEYIRFCFLTGVTRYGKVSVFSGLNNLNDITFSNEYAGICGITEEELRHNYDAGVGILAETYDTDKASMYQRLKDEYDGYHFSSRLLDVYNPYCVNHVFAKRKFEDYWCQSGVPTILSKSLMRNDYDVQKLNGQKVEQADLAVLSMQSTNPVALFYQTGYLTIKDFEERRQRYTLGYPNREVEAGIMANILKVYTFSPDGRRSAVYYMEDALEEGNPQEFIRLLKAFLSDIPNQLHKYVDRYENYYHTIFYCLTTLMGLDVEAEYSTSEGFIDMVIKTTHHIYVMELKVNGTAEDAMRQIEEKGYCAPFEADPRNVIRIGIGFSAEKHNVENCIIS